MSESPNSEIGKQPHFRLGYRPALDGLRGVFLLAVFVYHADANDSNMAFLPGGFLGVEGFFVLSGFLITVLLCQEWNCTDAINLRNFYGRRALRLLPALCVWLALVVIFETIFLQGSIVELLRSTIIPVLFYHMNWVVASGNFPWLVHHAWSLSVEEQFYLLWPLSLSILLRTGVKWRWIIGLVIGGIVTSALWRLALWFGGASLMRMYVGLDTNADALLTGCLIGLVASIDMLPVSPRFWKWINIAGCTSAFILIVLLFRVNMLSRPLYLGGFSLVAVGVGVIILMLLGSPPQYFRRVLESPWLVWIGRISYGLYLWHRTIFQLLDPSRVTWPEWVTLPLAAIIIFAVATASFYLVEQPFSGLKKQLSSPAANLTEANA